jgi:hypothetical protein
MLAMQDVVAVEGVDMGEDSPNKMSQHYLARVAKLGHARTLKETCSPSVPGTQERWGHATYLQGEIGTIYWHQLWRQRTSRVAI